MVINDDQINTLMLESKNYLSELTIEIGDIEKINITLEQATIAIDVLEEIMFSMSQSNETYGGMTLQTVEIYRKAVSIHLYGVFNDPIASLESFEANSQEALAQSIEGIHNIVSDIWLKAKSLYVKYIQKAFKTKEVFIKSYTKTIEVFNGLKDNLETKGVELKSFSSNKFYGSYLTLGGKTDKEAIFKGLNRVENFIQKDMSDIIRAIEALYKDISNYYKSLNEDSADKNIEFKGYEKELAKIKFSDELPGGKTLKIEREEKKSKGDNKYDLVRFKIVYHSNKEKYKLASKVEYLDKKDIYTYCDKVINICELSLKSINEDETKILELKQATLRDIDKWNNQVSSWIKKPGSSWNKSNANSALKLAHLVASNDVFTIHYYLKMYTDSLESVGKDFVKNLKDA